MSMSTVGAQLAALHSKSSQNPGSILATSKRKSDIVGRGVTHSAQHGHALKKSNFKASVLHEDARAAADVPLSTLRENAFSSMHQLVLVDTDFDLYLTLVNPQSLQSERGLLTREENEQLNKIIRGLLNLIGSVLQESSSRSLTSIYSSCLHVIEYLLRRYEIHIRNAQDFLIAFLPHHDDMIFQRVIQLVDLAAMPTFTFLRPYAAPENPNPNRSILAKQATKDIALLKIFCQTAQQLRTKQNRGAAMVTSFCCAVVVESLTLQARANVSLTESTVRTVIPFCLQACAWRPGGDWRAFGYVVLSTLSEHAELSMATVEKLSQAILKGGVVDMDALALLLSILPKKMTSLEAVDTSFNGLDIPTSTFHELCRVESIQTLIGNLNKEFRVTKLVATLFDMGLQHKMMDFVVSLVETPALETLWKESNLISSVAATTVNLVALTNLEPEEAAPLLSALKQVAPSKYDKGIAHIVEKHRTSDHPTKERIAKTLGVTISSKTDESLLLPPRVALEHPEASIRKAAMEQLVEQSGNDDDSLLAALLRHFVMEEEEEMTLAAASAIDKLLLRANVPFDKDACDLIIQAITHNSANTGELLEIAIKFAGHALKSLMATESDGIKPFVVILVAHCDSSNGKSKKGVASVACNAVCAAFSAKKTDYATARKIIATNPMITNSIVSKSSPSMQKKALVNLMTAIAIEIETVKSDRKALQVSAWKGINFLVEILSNDAMEVEDLSIVVRCIQFAVEKVEVNDVINLMSAFVQIASDDCYNAVSIPVLKAVSSAKEISLASVVFEIASRATLSSAPLVRLINLATQITKEHDLDASNYVVHVLSLLGHTDYEVRKAVLQMFLDAQHDSKSSTNRLLKSISSEHHSSILMDGAAALPSFLRSVVAGKKSPLRRVLLDQCTDLACDNWLPLEQAVGSMHAIAVLLNACELAGEASFPLLDRWSCAGSKILDALCATSSTATISTDLIESVVRMLKGALVHDPSELLGLFISSGPSKRGTRARSYSVGRSGGVSFTDQYPEEMFVAINKCLDIGEDPSMTALEICRTLIRDVLTSESWCSSIFKQLGSGKRVAITDALLKALPTQMSEDAVQCILHLPLEPADINNLLKRNGSDLQALAVMTDHVRFNAAVLGKSKAVADVIYSLFHMLRDVSSSDKDEGDDGGIAFAQISILHALASLVSIDDSGFSAAKQEDLVSHTALLVNLAGNTGGSSIRQLSSWKARKTALTLMSRLCSFHPPVVVKGMVQAMLTCINPEQINSSDSVQKVLASIRDVLTSIVPVFLHSCDAAKISLIDMLNSFLDEVDEVTNISHAQHILKSMTDALASTGDSNSVTRFFCLLLARASKIRKKIMDDVVTLASSLNQTMQATCLLGICALTNNLLLYVADASHHDADAMFVFVVKHLCGGSDSSHVALWYCRYLCGVILQISSLPSMEDYVTNSNDSNLCLQLWQDLLLLQSTSSRVEGCLDATQDDGSSNKKILERCMDDIDQALSVIQHYLPIPAFLASTTSLIEDGENEGLRTKALRFLAERASGISSKAPEASLFLDLLPMIVGLTEDVRDDDEGMMRQQSAAIVVEQFGRTFCLPANVSPRTAKPFLDALSSFTSTLSRLASRTNGREAIANQLACTLAFLIAHLDKVLSPSLLSSYTTEEIDLVASLARKVPARQLLPAVTRALKSCSTASESSTLLKLTSTAVEQMPRAEIGAVTGHVLNSILYCCETETISFDLISNVLIALVMKLSENQLRPVYARLRTWRGDDNPTRKFAFWNLSSALSKELKSIFLPYLSTVVSDALTDLDLAVSVLCASRKVKKAKVGTVESLTYLPALLACLGHGFAADARDGGNWIREDGEDRYALFREPLSALLLSRVPSDFPFASSSSSSDIGKNPYQELIVNDGGVISCLVSLASAAGNDTLWKPLNHAVLTACGYEERVEVQRAGLVCLLKLMQTLGEEYMVLLPECLPVLSELLEADEGTAAIARECVDLSEEFLGESLEDSLR
ncbi:hypothetical protein MHU86_6778 [Fragilaria crotonensis]|nr:hypothetical protein MHU86_6778 [Fragilaria crotonensis]